METQTEHRPNCISGAAASVFAHAACLLGLLGYKPGPTHIEQHASGLHVPAPDLIRALPWPTVLVQVLTQPKICHDELF